MTYQYYREWGLTNGPAAWVQLLIPLVLACVILGVSWFLLKRKQFQLHLVFLAIMTFVAVTLGLKYTPDRFILWLPVVFLVTCLWDHYWARNQAGTAPMPLKKAKAIQIAAAAILAACGVLVIGVGSVQGRNGWDLGTSLLVGAVYVAIHSYVHRNDVTANQFDRLL